MCWNENVSIYTFIFCISTLVLIYINNKYSEHKIEIFMNPYVYVFSISYITMQFFEFILWRNIDNYFINNLVSILGLLLLTIQPIASLSMLEILPLRNKLISIYSIPAFIYIIYQLKNKNINTSISKNGHLKWNWTTNTKFFSLLVHMFYIFFLYFSLFYNKYYSGIFITLPLFIVMYYYYYKDGTAGSLWCWSINITMVYFLLKLIYINTNLRIKY
jgi:hypothetical protein